MDTFHSALSDCDQGLTDLANALGEDKRRVLLGTTELRRRTEPIARQVLARLIHEQQGDLHRAFRAQAKEMSLLGALRWLEQG